MCGWGILVNRDGRPVEAAMLQAMASAVAHRGPDAEGIVKLGAVGLAHRRLAVIDVNDRSNQPMQNGDNWLLFNGMIYNYRELRRELEGLGHVFQTLSDTEVLLHALSEWWVDALPRLQGMFSFSFYDARRRKMLLARDRFGIKPLCYHLSDKVLIAGSEAKQLLATGLVGTEPDHDVMRIFLHHGLLNLDDRSFFRDIKALPPGHLLVHDLASNHSVKLRWYRLAEHVLPVDLPYREACERLRAMLDDAVQSRHVSNVRVGASLSGGIDSSSIAAASALVVGDPGQFPLFTIYHANQRHDERGYAAQVTRKFGFRHIEVPVSLLEYYTPQWLEDFAWSQDQPLPSGSHFNEHALFKSANEEGVTVMLDGQGADEYFGGYGEFWLAAQRAALRQGRFTEVARNIRGRSLAVAESPVLTVRKMIGALRRHGNPASPLLADLWRGGGVESRQAEAPPPDFRSLSFDELERSSIPYQLHSQDRNAMQFGIESRVPFLDHRLVEFVCSLPSEYLVGRGWQKRILRDAMPELPDSIRWRRNKIGFSSPDAEFGLQYPDQLASMLDDAATTLAPIVDSVQLRQRIGRYRKNPARYDPAIFRLISLAAWVRRFGVAL